MMFQFYAAGVIVFHSPTPHTGEPPAPHSANGKADNWESRRGCFLSPSNGVHSPIVASPAAARLSLAPHVAAGRSTDCKMLASKLVSRAWGGSQAAGTERRCKLQTGVSK